jgi:methionyl-tRNA synthetase
MAETYYVTTPIYYVNDVPHIGHSYTTIAADVLSRYYRSQGRDVRFLTGTDEHGIKIVKAAAERGVGPKELADEVVVQFEQLWRDLNISNDDFIRTSQPRHERRVQEIIRRLVERGEIYLGKYEGWYDEGQEEFVTESTARDNEFKSAITGRALVRYSEPSYFFRLSKWVPRLIEHIRATPSFILPEARRNEVLSKLAAGVEDLSISRPLEKLNNWGVVMPNDPAHSVYVWIDALSNYYTALGCPEVGDEYDAAHARYWPAQVHLIGKDILWFHAVYWPCLLMALDLPLPRCVFAHGWWTSEGKKMSKSLGNFVSRQTIADICRDFSRDAYRYFLLRQVPFGADGDFSHQMLLQRYNTELANGLGNLLSRTVNMIGRYFEGAIPPPCPQQAQDSAAVRTSAENLVRAMPEAMAACQLGVPLEKLLALTSETNRYIDFTGPFKLAKDPAQRDRLAAVLYVCAEALRIIFLHLRPFMPESAEKGLAQLGWSVPPGRLSELAGWGLLPAGTKTAKAEALFPRKT